MSKKKMQNTGRQESAAVVEMRTWMAEQPYMRVALRLACDLPDEGLRLLQERVGTDPVGDEPPEAFAQVVWEEAVAFNRIYCDRIVELRKILPFLAEIELLRLLSLHVRREFTALLHYAANESPDEPGMTDPEFIAHRCTEYDVALLNIARSTLRGASA